MPENTIRCRRTTPLRQTSPAIGLLLAPVLLAMAIAAPAQAMPPPDAMVRAFALVEAWVRTGDPGVPLVPSLDQPMDQHRDKSEDRNETQPPAEPEAGAVPISPAAAVLLRLDGVLVADEAAESPISTGLAVGVDDAGRATTALHLAAARAIAAAVPRVGPPGDPAWARVVVSVEVSGPLIPFAAEQLAQASILLSPGVEGVAARLGDRTRLAFPAGMLARSQEPGPTLASLVVDLARDGSLALLPLEQLRARGFQIYRFRTTHLAQATPGGQPMFLHRGGWIVPAGELDVPGLRMFAGGLAAHLRERRWPGIEPFGMLGTLNASTGRFDPTVASPAEQAIAALALARYAQEVNDQPSRDAALAIVDALAEIDPAEPAPFADPASAAAVIVAITQFAPQDINADPGRLALYDACRERLRDAFDGERFAPSLPESARGLVAWAMLRADAFDHAFDAAADAAGIPLPAPDRAAPDRFGSAAVRAVFRETPQGRLVGQMPWIVYAVRDAVGADDALPQAVALRGIRELVWDHQLRMEDLEQGLTADLAGGIVFTASASPLPTWQAVRPLAGLAAMLDDDRLTQGSLFPNSATPGSPAPSAGSNEKPIELARLVSSLRFIRQLAGDASHGWMERSPRKSRWGIRLAPWDQRMPPDASSLALLALTDTLDAVTPPTDHATPPAP